MKRMGVLRGKDRKRELISKTQHYSLRDGRERAPSGKRAALKRKWAMQGRSLRAQESIKLLILSEDEPDCKRKLPPECLLTSKLSLRADLKARLPCHFNALVPNLITMILSWSVWVVVMVEGRGRRTEVGLMWPFNRERRLCG